MAILTMGAGPGCEGVEADWLGTPKYWSNWDRETNLTLVTEAGLELVRANDEVVWENGERVSFLSVVARRTYRA